MNQSPDSVVGLLNILSTSDMRPLMEDWIRLIPFLIETSEIEEEERRRHERGEIRSFGMILPQPESFGHCQRLALTLVCKISKSITEHSHVDLILSDEIKLLFFLKWSLHLDCLIMRCTSEALLIMIQLQTIDKFILDSIIFHWFHERLQELEHSRYQTITNLVKRFRDHSMTAGTAGTAAATGGVSEGGGRGGSCHEFPGIQLRFESSSSEGDMSPRTPRTRQDEEKE
jgi:hypothetical protein